jgi:hypothetical protein
MSEVKLPSGQMMKWREQEFPTFYANLMGFAMSPFDISLLFGEIGDSTPTEVTGIPKVRIILSPEQASNLMKLLGVAIETYVANNGQLRTSGAVNVAEINKQVESQKIRVD